jgi:hypothetical protein
MGSARVFATTDAKRFERVRGLTPARTVALAALAGVVFALAIGVGAGGATASGTGRWVACSGHPRSVRHLQVSRLSCSEAVTAIKRGQLAFVPAGLAFSTRGFTCRSPVGPPEHGPRFTVCRRSHRAFRFYSIAEPR